MKGRRNAQYGAWSRKRQTVSPRGRMLPIELNRGTSETHDKNAEEGLKSEPRRQSLGWGQDRWR